MVAVLAVALTMTVNTGAASAATSATTTLPSSGEQTSASAQCAASEIDAQTAADETTHEMVQLDPIVSAELAITVSALAQEKGITSNAPAEFVQQDGVKAYVINIGGVKATSVTFPISGDRFVQPSNQTFVLDDSGALNQFSESTVVEREDGILDLTTYRDGVLEHSAELDPATVLAGFGAESTSSIAAATPQQCLAAVLGVSAIAAGIILVLCGGSCAVPVTPPTAVVCAACIGGIAVIGGASIAAVMGCF